jgi:hypothetical protein
LPSLAKAMTGAGVGGVVGTGVAVRAGLAVGAWLGVALEVAGALGLTGPLGVVPAAAVAVDDGAGDWAGPAPKNVPVPPSGRFS